MSHKSELSIIREQQLARLRETTGTPERFVADFACARHDRGFRVTFARFSPAQRFRCESVDKTESNQATTMERLQGLLRPAEALRVRAEEVDFSSVSCAWCGDNSHWIRCAKCKAMVCGARSSGRSFKAGGTKGTAMKISGAVAVLATAMAASLIGTPYLLYEYECQGYDVRHCVYYTRCIYIGVQGWREFHPELVPDKVGCRAVKLFAVARPLFEWSPQAAPLKLYH